MFYFRLLLLLLFFPQLSLSAQKTNLLYEGAKIPNVPSFSFYYKGKQLTCYPLKLIKKSSYKDRIEYICINKDIKITKNETEEIDKEQGQIATEDLISTVKSKIDIGETYRVQIDARDANNRKKIQFLAKQQLLNRRYGKLLTMILPAKIYASLRPQFSNNGDEGAMKLQDGGSRGGFFYYELFGDDIELMAQYEAGISFNNDVPFINISNIDNSSRRLSFLSLKYHESSVKIGKYWSAYYDIAAFTDYFMAYGAQASGAFNNSSDGGQSGTGRPDSLVQLSYQTEQFNSKLQIQLKHTAPDNIIDAEYEYGVSGSLVYKGWEDIRWGASFAFAKFDEINPSMNNIGIYGDDQSYITGFTYKQESYSINGTLSYTKNHMNDDQGIYFDALGAEIYFRYNINDTFRLAAGYNRLSPIDNRYQSSYNIKKNILSLQYTFGAKTYNDLVYIEVSVPNGRLSNGEKLSTSVAIGLRYLLSR